MRAASILLLLAAAAAAFIIEVKDTLARQVVVELGLTSRADIRLDIAFRDKRITLKTKDLPIGSCLERLAESCGGKLFVHARDFHIVPAWKHTLLSALYEKKITLGYENESASKLVQVIATHGALDLAIDPAFVDFKARIVVQDMLLGQALDTILAQGKAAYDLRYGVVFVAGRKRLATLRKLVPIPGAQSLPDKPLRIQLTGSPLAILEQATKQLGLALEIEGERRALGAGTTTVQTKRVTLAQLLACVLTPTGLKAEVVSGTRLVVNTDGPR